METYTRQTAQAVAVQDDPNARELLHRAFERTARWRADFVGFAASLAALLVGFVPPSQFGGGNPLVYVLIVGGGALGLGLLVPFLFYKLRKDSWKQPEGSEVTSS